LAIEQKYLDLLFALPKDLRYNFFSLPAPSALRAGSTFGIKIIEESRANMQGRTHTADTRAKISAANQGANNPRYGVSAVNATPIFVYNADTNKLIANYSGMRSC
jgi:hypothetical protein